MEAATKEILHQLKLLGVGDWLVIISTNIPLRKDGVPYSNQRQPIDGGAAVYFKIKNRPQVLAVDKWNKVEDNLWAIAKDIEAQRGRIRWGVGTIEQAFAGYTALPAPGSTADDWRTVLGVTVADTFEEVSAAYKAKALSAHPDRGGSHERMAWINQAWQQAKQYFRA